MFYLLTIQKIPNCMTSLRGHRTPLEYSIKKQKQKNYWQSLKPRLIFIDKCEEIKLFICLDKVTVKEYTVIFSIY